MKAKPLAPALALALALAVALAGCTRPQESRESVSGGALTFRVDVPEGATHVRIDVAPGNASEGAQLSVRVADPDGTPLEEQTFGAWAPHSTFVGVDPPATLVVTVSAAGGECAVHVRASALMADDEVRELHATNATLRG